MQNVNVESDFHSPITLFGPIAAIVIMITVIVLVSLAIKKRLKK